MLRKKINNFIINFKYACRLRKPLLILRLFCNYLQIIFLGKKPLRYLDFAVHYRCNLNCRHCFASGLIDNKRSCLSPREYSQVVRGAMRLGAVNFSFQGGEPLLLANLTEYIRAAYPRKNLISVTTNATLLDERQIKKLKQAGVDILTISLDSGIARDHDSFRGQPGTFARARRAIFLAIRHGLKVTIGATVSHENIRSAGLQELIEFAQRLRVVLFLALAVPVGRWQGRGDIQLTSEDHVYLQEMLRKYPLLRTDFSANYIHSGCGAVKEILYLTPYGDILPCPFINQSLGNVRKNSLPAIRQQGLQEECYQYYADYCLAAARNN